MIAVFDTCIVLDYLLDRTPFADDAEALMIKAAQEDIEGIITVKSLMDIHYVLKHTLHNEKKTREVFETLLDSFTLVDSAAEDAVKALLSEVKDYEDALMIETAKSIRADCIITRNEKDYRKSTVKVIAPEKILEILAG